ncbi:hypothetical protein QCM80_41275 [Bradyrhizobium sp. SSUT112]|nr:hypothetical protein [Bradyrhizobium sp. SSUT112]MDH2356985.1 hypothetical protein [Bradyrhizobium sp. SSUT112]
MIALSKMLRYVEALSRGRTGAFTPIGVPRMLRSAPRLRRGAQLIRGNP